MPVFAENLDELKKALKGLLNAHTSYLGDLGSGAADNGVLANLRYMIEDLKRVAGKQLVDRWLAEADMERPEVFADLEGRYSESAEFSEAGKRLSAASMKAIEEAIGALTALRGADEKPDSAVEDVEAAVAEAAILLEELVPHFATEAAEDSDATVGVFSGGYIAEASRPDQNSYRMLMIKEGMSLNRVNYPGAILRESAEMWEGKPLYIDHPNPIGSVRSLSTKAGWWTDVKFEENVKLHDGRVVSGLTGTAHLISEEASPVPWFPKLMRETVSKGMPSFVGVSIYAAGDQKIKKDALGYYRECAGFKRVISVDAVAEAGADGQTIQFAASKYEVDELTLDLSKLTNEEIASLARDRGLLGETKPPADQTPPATPPPATPPPANEDRDAILAEARQAREEAREAQTQTTAVLEEIRLERSQNMVSRLIAEARLSPSLEKRVRDTFANKIVDEAAVRAELEALGNIVNETRNEFQQQNFRAMAPGTVIRPGALDTQINVVEQHMDSLDDFFGNLASEKKGKVHRIRSFAEFYMGVTGDHNLDMNIYPEHSVLGDWYGRPFAEALPGATHVVGGGTITMSSLLGTSMNKALVNQYQTQPLWWRPVVDIQPLNNMKIQDRIRLHNFGSLTERTVDGEEYTELDWGETREQYTPTEFGNLVTVGRRAIINDDLRGISRVPRLLAQSAGITINEFISALFTANSGAGPALSDGFTVFNAAQHQGNLMSQPLSYAAALDATHTMMKMTNDAGKRIGVVPNFMLVPIDLRAEGYKIINSEREPDNANNAVNIISQAPDGISTLIVVPQWTNAERWYIMASPTQVVGIEVGFLFGREEPEMFSQTDPTVGMVYTNDVMSWKVRHDYGADWLDYRAAVRGN